jgi:hypothetical protein
VAGSKQEDKWPGKYASVEPSADARGLGSAQQPVAGRRGPPRAVLPPATASGGKGRLVSTRMELLYAPGVCYACPASDREWNERMKRANIDSERRFSAKCPLERAFQYGFWASPRQPFKARTHEHYRKQCHQPAGP